MSKTLMIVICDFLLLSLLSLANFEEPQQDNKEAENIAIEQSYSDSQMLELLKMSLDSERQRREVLTSDVEKLSKSAAISQQQAQQHKETLKTREQELASLAKNKAQLEKEKQEILQRTQLLQNKVLTSEERNLNLQKDMLDVSNKLTKYTQERIELEQKLGTALQSDSFNKAKLQSLQSELKENKLNLDKLKEESQSLKNENKAIELEKQALSTQLEVASTKTQIYEENLKRVEALVKIEKTEKDKIMEHAETLAIGVSDLATSQEKISDQVKKLRPKTASEIFENVKNSFVNIKIESIVDTLLGDSAETVVLKALPVNWDDGVWILFNADTTILQPRTVSRQSPKSLTISVYAKKFTFDAIEVYSTALDPRILAIKLPKNFVEKEELQALNFTTEPYAFEDCISINPQKYYYGQSPFKADFENPNFMELDVSLFQSIFGSYSPSQGHYVLSRTGDILGLMANASKAIKIDHIQINKALELGKNYKQQDADLFLKGLDNKYKTIPTKFR